MAGTAVRRFALKLYSRPLSPFASRCRIQIYAKDLPVEIANVAMPNPAEFLALNPIGKVPALEVDGQVIPESQVICDFLEARFPDPPLVPVDPLARAQTQLLARFADLYLLPLIDSLADDLEPSTSALAPRRAEMTKRLDQLEALLVDSPGAAERQLSLADCALVPPLFFLERMLPAIDQPLFFGRPRLSTWWDSVQKHTAVERVLREMGDQFERMSETLVERASSDPASGTDARGEHGAFLTRYLCQKLVPRMVEAEKRGGFGAELTFATVMFVDLHGYTTLAERFDPERVLSILNRSLAVVIEVVFRNDGAVLQLLGDGALVVFGVHQARDDDVHRAARTALEIHSELREAQVGVQEEERVAVAIGIDCGDVVCGNVGHRERLEFAVVGDTVNVAARMQSLARSGETLLTSTTADAIRDEFTVEMLEETMVKGRTQPVHVCRLVAREELGPQI